MGAAAVITSGKGGAGKSTVTVGLGRALAERGRRVLLVDCDAGLRSLDRMTGTEENLLFDISDVIFGRCAPINAIYPCTGTDGLFLLPAPSLQENMVKAGVMKKLVPLLKNYYDYVLLDSPAGIGAGFRAAACAADRAVVVCNSDPVCLRGTAVVKKQLEEFEIADSKLVINRFNYDFFHATGAYEDLDRVIDDAEMMLLGVIPEDYAMASAFLKGGSADSRSEGMLALSRMAGRFEGEMIPLAM